MIASCTQVTHGEVICVACPQLARHEAAKVKPGSLEAKNKRPDVQFAKK
jgi:hypothetical protein